MGRGNVSNYLVLAGGVVMLYGINNKLYMNLIQLVDNLKDVKEAEKFIATEIPNVEFDQIDVYLKNKPDINSDVILFDAETNESKAEIEINGNKCFNLFPLYMTQEMVESYKKIPGEKLTDIEIAKKLLEYRIKDA